jgi:hypothetical protein
LLMDLEECVRRARAPLASSESTSIDRDRRLINMRMRKGVTIA